MPTDDASPDGSAHDPGHQFRHDLKTPLSVVLGRAQLLARGVQRSPGLSDEERTKLLQGIAAIEATVHTMVTLIDGMAGPSHDGRREIE